MSGEEDLIRRITRAVPSVVGRAGRRAGVTLGIGDDALAMRVTPGMELVVTTDAFVDGVHFWADRHPADSVGYKALVRAASDIAAMGGRPRFFLMTLALPKVQTGAWFDRFLSGMGRAARSLGVALIGGDTTRAAAVSLGITVLGEVAQRKAVTRGGARPGDILWVSGPLGGAQLGLELMRSGLSNDRRFRSILEPHLYPHARVDLGHWLAERGAVTSMIDISDGLSTDLSRLCRASGVGAMVLAARIQRVDIPSPIAIKLGKRRADPLKMALHGGDDYELLFTVPPRRLRKLFGAPNFGNLNWIGVIEQGSKISLYGQKFGRLAFSARGWDPFRRNS